ncbi:MAG: ATP-binding protein [Deltaproteobacteria bacterium]|jgi:serine/threonine-protein kinase RsbW|nr:ATP-binding protein [Deltaproteobacteria bacterium]
MHFQSVFKIKSDTRYLTPLREWISSVQKLVDENDFPKKALLPCSMALVEAVDNAIFHAHDGVEDLPIEISLVLSDGSIVMEVTDKGVGIGEPVIPGPDEMADHGRGLFIIHQVMSKVESKIVDGTHHMRMEYKL